MKIAFTTKETSWVSANYAHGAGEMSVREAFETYKNNSLKLF